MSFGYLGAIALAALVGLSLGAIGSGGSIIMTPVLVYVAHIPPETAVGMSLGIVGTTSLVGMLLHLRRGNLALKPAVLFSLIGMVGSFLGSTGTHLLPRRMLMLLFSCIMLVVGWAMWRGTAALRQAKLCSISQCLLAGFVVGLLTGFLGVGGGFLIVPALVLFAGLDTRMAARTSLAIIAFNCAAGLLGQLRYVRIDWSLLSGFLVFAISGMAVDATLSGRLPETVLRRIFSITILVLAIAIGLQNSWDF